MFWDQGDRWVSASTKLQEVGILWRDVHSLASKLNLFKTDLAIPGIPEASFARWTPWWDEPPPTRTR